MALRTRLLTLLVAVLLAGCGGGGSDSGAAVLSDTPDLVPYEGMQAAQVFGLMRTSVRQAGSVHVRMESVNGGDRLRSDMRVSRDGVASGWFEPVQGQRAELLRIGDRAWYKGNAQFLDARGLTGVTPDGPWTPVTDDGYVASYLNYTKIPFYTGELLRTPQKNLRKVEGKVLGGQLSIGLRPRAGTGTLYVSADGSGELVGYQDDTFTYRFSDWDEPVTAEAPDGSGANTQAGIQAGTQVGN
ncbi:hypothetical protein KIH74_27325 [Kineosporia sp. J2-2]|uniref:Lipoprotein n=1 Tax=Kineosporia corallincola TaxID=2835133 RepID=A0ABS5TNL2_9ACTN|nr:hypothetical protein [Kineosporia corallincola]MBT0772686.1 hypothetical protein [Kineosporia corallincola]